MADTPGLSITEMFDAAEDGSIKALYLVGENPMLSEPDAGHVRQALKKLEFFVAQDIFMTESAALANVVLPAVTFAEKDGTFTNTERGVQLIRKAVAPVGQSRADGSGIEDPAAVVICRVVAEGAVGQRRAAAFLAENPATVPACPVVAECAVGQRRVAAVVGHAATISLRSVPAEATVG